MFVRCCGSFLVNGADERANDLKFSNVLAYLGSSLRLDVEGAKNDLAGENIFSPVCESVHASLGRVAI